jgi:hypothetical protein
MLTRRAVLQLAVALAGLPRVAWASRRGWPLPGDPWEADPPPPETFVVDSRYPASMAAGRETAREGIPVKLIAGDVTALWYYDLYFRWKRGPAVIAGMTGADALFCLDVLARDAGLRVLARTDHGSGLLGDRAEAPASCFVATGDARHDCESSVRYLGLAASRRPISSRNTTAWYGPRRARRKRA